MNYALNKPTGAGAKPSLTSAVKALWPLVSVEKKRLFGALLFMIINATLNLLMPLVVAHALDTYIAKGDYRGVLLSAGLMILMALVGLVVQYLLTMWMGGIGQRVLFRLRNAVFTKLQELPVAFFNQNKAGDLISRINNDTDKLNQFFSQSLMQFVGSVFLMAGAGIFLVALNPKLGVATLVPAGLIVIFTQLVSGWVKHANAKNMRALGGMSAEIQESLDNFKVIVAFNRRDYFRKRFAEANSENYTSAIRAGIANNVFMPVYGFASNLAQLILLAFGIYLIIQGQFTIGLLISFISYANNFYNPLRQLAALWTNFQVAMAGWDRVSEILALESDLTAVQSITTSDVNAVLEFSHVSFRYPDGKDVLHDVNFALEKGKTYALVGPTGGGKTTTASLMARLYDPTGGVVYLGGKDIRSYDQAERAKKIGFILQEPFLFNGTVRENILYGNEELSHVSNEELEKEIRDSGLGELLVRFPNGLATNVGGGDMISLGQKQLIAFMRAVLRKPELLILDEATANIDTVTEQLLDTILKNLPPETARVIIAHRLNTIESADEIFFVNGGEVTRAGSFDHAVEMLLNDKRES